MATSTPASDSPFGAMLKILQKGPTHAPRYGTAQWFALCRELKKHGLLGPVAPALETAAPSPVARKVAQWRGAHERAMRARAQLLAEFAERARAEGLHGLLIKGMGLSQLAFGDPFARQSGDMDLLVDADDIPKADYVLRSLGWKQPGEARLVRPLHDSGELTDDILANLESPYALRSNVILPHVTNYYREGAAGFETIELHDRFHGLDAEQARALLWAKGMREVAGAGLLTPGPAVSLLISGLSLHEDSETVRANTTERGTMGLKACLDIHGLLSTMDENQLAEARALARRLAVSDKLVGAFANATEAFPQDAPLLELVADAPLASAWSLPYLERIRDPRARAASGVAHLADALTQMKVASNSDSWRPLPVRLRSSIATEFEARVIAEDQRTRIEWKLPATALVPAENIVAQAIALSFDDPAQLGVRANVFQDDGLWKCTLQSIGPNTVDGHANKIGRGDAAEAAARTEPDGSLVLVTWVPTSVKVLPSLWHKLYGQLHRRIAGIDFSDVAEEAIAASQQKGAQ